MSRIQFFGDTQVTVGISEQCVPRAKEAADHWNKTVLGAALAKIKQSPEWLQAAQLEERRTTAQKRIDALTARIAEIKGVVAESIAKGEGDPTEAAMEIEKCSREIAAARLTVDSVDSLVPQFTGACEREAVQQCGAITKTLLQQLQKREAAIEDKIVKALEPLATELVEVWGCMNRVNNAASWTCKILMDQVGARRQVSSRRGISGQGRGKVIEPGSIAVQTSAEPGFLDEIDASRGAVTVRTRLATFFDRFAIFVWR